MRNYYFVLFTLAYLVTFPSLATSEILDDYSLTVGVAKGKITPIVETFDDKNKNGRFDDGEPFTDLNQNGKWDPVWLAGYRGGRYALGVHDDLWARALAITLKQTTIIFVSLDFIGYLFDEVSLVKKEISEKINIPASNIFIASTHNHSGPDTIGIWGGPDGKSGKNGEYLKEIREKIVASVVEAQKGMKPARIYFGITDFPDLIHDARTPSVTNGTLLSFRAVDFDGGVIATMVNYAVHAEVMNEKNRMVTADFPGAMREKLESHFGGTALFFAGDIGGMQTPKVFFRTFSKCKQFGRKVADQVIKSLKDRPAVGIDYISVKSGEILFPVENPRFLGAIERGLFSETQKFLRKDNDKTFLPSDIALIELGPARFITVPGELFPELGNKLREKLTAEYKFLIGLCNNEIGYIVPREEWKENGYEESMSLGPKTGDILIESFSNLLTD